MPGEDLSLVVDQDRIAEAKALYAVGDLSDLSFGVCSRIAFVWAKRLDWKISDLHV
jgi:hypothetical protein